MRGGANGEKFVSVGWIIRGTTEATWRDQRYSWLRRRKDVRSLTGKKEKEGEREKEGWRMEKENFRQGTKYAQGTKKEGGYKRYV